MIGTRNAGEFFEEETNPECHVIGAVNMRNASEIFAEGSKSKNMWLARLVREMQVKFLKKEQSLEYHVIGTRNELN